MKIEHLLLTSVLSFSLISCKEKDEIPNETNPSIPTSNEFLKSATYFGDEWVINFWNSELNNIENDFLRIKSDGFNSITLVIPWREVQPTTSPISYNDYFFVNLKKVMDCAQSHGLYVMTRVGYNWDFYHDNEEVANDRFRFMMNSQEYQNAWYDYLRVLNENLTKYPCFLGGFMCWEDFWHNVTYAKYASNQTRSEAIECAVNMGYQSYIHDHYTLPMYSSLANDTFTDYSQIYIPGEKTKAFSLFYDFYDDYLINVLKNSQSVFPNLSMETRLDDDLVYDGDNSKYYSHSKTYSSEGSSFTCVYYGIPMGFENKSDRISANRALRMTETILTNFNKHTNSKSLFIDQFLFYDDTPKFDYNTRLLESEVNKYLENSAYVLHDTAKGYAVWTYKNYRSNMLFNPQFALGLDGWNSTGTYLIVEDDKTHNKYLKLTNGELTQTVNKRRNHFVENDQLYFSFDYKVSEPTNVQIQVSDVVVNAVLSPANSHFKTIITDTGFDNYNVKIQTNETINIDNIRAYTWIQDGKLYSENWDILDGREGIRKLNYMLDYLSQNNNKNLLYSTGEFINVHPEDNVYGVSAGLIKYSEPLADDVDYVPSKEALFMTPGTKFVFEAETKSNPIVSFNYTYQYLAKDWGSDGISISLKITDNNDALFYSMSILPSEGVKRFETSVPEIFIKKNTKFEIACFDGGNNNSSADWLIITDLVLN